MRWPFNWLEPPEDTCSEPAFKEYFGVPALPLPEAVLPKISLQGAIAARLSCRRFMGAPLTMLQLATVLKCAYGVQGKTLSGDMELLERPVPSGGGLYPLELYALVQNVEGVEPGIYHYAALHHMLEQVQPVRLSKPAVSRLFMDQPYITGAAVIVVLVAVVERCLWKYGDRGYRYILFEAGHVAQNVNLVSSALELGSLNLGGFFDADLASLLLVDLETEVPLYGVAVGVQCAGDRSELRQPSSCSCQKLDQPQEAAYSPERERVEGGRVGNWL
jgi:SagB-type dehydrogenase family enzyme